MHAYGELFTVGGATLTVQNCIPVGLLYSRSGPYARMGAEMMDGALLAIEEVNAARWGFTLKPVIYDPGGRLDGYDAACSEMIGRHRVQHIVGCYTSLSRKQILPQLERNNILLWHPARYEGFEASENIIYVGAAPNQHVVPLASYMITGLGRDVFCIGSNYIWTWEMNRVLREIVSAAGGQLVAERVVPFGSTDVVHLVDAILDKRPPVIFNTLVGETSYAFFREWARASKAARIEIPILSCSLCEPELALIGPDASVGHISSATYFSSIERPQNEAFVRRFRIRFGSHRTPFSDAEASYVCVMLLGRAIRRAGGASVDAVRSSVMLDHFEAPQGPIHLDPSNNHCYLTPRIARSMPGQRFGIFWEAAAPLRPDPYLARLDIDGEAASRQPANDRYRFAPHLRIVK